MKEEEISINFSCWKNFKKKYPFRKWIFRFGIFILLLLVLLAWAGEDFKNPKNIIYGEISCNQNTICENPLYYCNSESEVNFDKKLCSHFPVTWYENEFMYPGQSFNLPAPFIIKYFTETVIIVLGLCFGLNHILNELKRKKNEKRR